MAYLIDTNHCSYIINRDPRITDKLQSLSSETVGVSIITHAELLYMAERSARKEQNLEAIQSFLSEVEIYFLDEETASIYSNLKAKVWLNRSNYARLISKCQQIRERNLKLSKFLKPYPERLISFSLLLMPSTTPLVVRFSK